MEMTVNNPQKGWLETIDVELTEENTTWFDTSADDRKIYIITDVEGDLLISEPGYTYPLRIYDMSIADIGYNPKKATELERQYA